MLLRKDTKYFWGGMAAGGLIVGGISIGSLWLLDNWLYANIFFRVLPPTLLSVLMIYEAIRLRSIRRNGNMLFGVDQKIVPDTEEVATK